MTENVAKRLEETIRQERGWLIASLVSSLGTAKVDLAEDVAQDAILRALSVWPYKGVPENPRAWLRRVAGNIAIDQIRRQARLVPHSEGLANTPSSESLITPTLQDPELDLLVICCDPRLQESEQMALALNLGCGFTAGQIAPLFHLSENALAQRLARGKRKIRQQSGQLARHPTRFAMRARLPEVLRVLYLMHCSGYFPRSGAFVFDSVICREALRLCQLIPKFSPAHHSECQALSALICLQMARFPARSDAEGALIPLDQQDRSLWQTELIAEGFAALREAQHSPILTRYHLEAAIAAQHALAPSWKATNWAQISWLYTQLDRLAPSPAVAINLAVAQLLSDDLQAAQQTLDQIPAATRLTEPAGLALAKAELNLRLNDSSKEDAIRHLKTALQAPQSHPVQAYLAHRIDQLEAESQS